MLEALADSSARLSFHVFAPRRLARITTQRSSCDHIRAHMPNAWLGCWYRPHSQTACSRFLVRIWGLALNLHCHLLSEAAAIAAETDSAANQFGAHGRARGTTARHVSVFCGLWLPLPHLSDLWIGEQL